MKENLKPLAILFGFVGSVVLVFFLESKVLLENRKVATANTEKASEAEQPAAPAGEIKEIIEDFEKANDNGNLEDRHVFRYGSITVEGSNENTKGKGYSGKKAVKVVWAGKDNFGGWGKGIGHFYSFDKERDYVNVFVLYPKGDEDDIKIVLQDDDNGNGSYEEQSDDAFAAGFHLKPSSDWQLISVPLKNLQDQTQGGDGILNTSEGEGNLITFLVEFTKKDYKQGTTWYFDHISFTKGPLPVGKDISDIPVSIANLYK
jgi:hypothetical protein